MILRNLSHFPHISRKTCYNYNMYRLSLIISEIYNKYLPLAEKEGIVLNLDFSDTTKEITDPDRIKQYLDDNLNDTLKRSNQGEVTISVDKTCITITDSATTLSHTACALLSNRYIDVSSRVGFGTTIKIFLQPRELPTTPAEKAPLSVEQVGVAAALDKTAPEPVLQSEVKVTAKQGKHHLGLGAKLKLKGQKRSATSSSSAAKSLKSVKPTKKLTPSTSKTSAKVKTSAKNRTSAQPAARKTKPNRQLAAAARKADKEVKRIAKKAEKQAKKISKSTQKAAKKVTKATQKVSQNTKATSAKAHPLKSTTKKTVRKLKLS